MIQPAELHECKPVAQRLVEQKSFFIGVYRLARLNVESGAIKPGFANDLPAIGG